jgi:hypothetical protein
MAHLDELLTAAPAGCRKLVVTDSLFSMDGDFADLRGLADLRQKHGFMLVIDEAHATLVCGDKGGGAAEMLGVAEQVSSATLCHTVSTAAVRAWATQHNGGIPHSLRPLQQAAADGDKFMCCTTNHAILSIKLLAHVYVCSCHVHMLQQAGHVLAVSCCCGAMLQVDVHVGTLSKAVGSLGGFVACSSRLRRLLLNKGRPVIFSTALPLPVVAAARAALQVAARWVLLDDTGRPRGSLFFCLQRDTSANMSDHATSGTLFQEPYVFCRPVHRTAGMCAVCTNICLYCQPPFQRAMIVARRVHLPCMDLKRPGLLLLLVTVGSPGGGSMWQPSRSTWPPVCKSRPAAP